MCVSVHAHVCARVFTGARCSVGSVAEAVGASSRLTVLGKVYQTYHISHRVRLSSSRDGDVCKWFTGVNISLASPPVFPIVTLVMEEECSGGCDA